MYFAEIYFSKRSYVAHCWFQSIALIACLSISRSGFGYNSRWSWNALRYCVNLSLETPRWGDVEADVSVSSEEPVSETNRKVLEDRLCLIVECTFTIFTPVSLKHSIAAVPNPWFGTATWAIDAVMPVNLCQRVRCSTLRNIRLDWEHRLSSDTNVSPLLAVTSSYCW